MGSRGSRQAVPPRVEQLSNPVRNVSTEDSSSHEPPDSSAPQSSGATTAKHANPSMSMKELAPSNPSLSNPPPAQKSLTRQEMEDEKFLQTLVRRQKEQMPKIIGDLSKNGRKTLHYAWWLFPTELPGASEPLLGG